MRVEIPNMRVVNTANMREHWANRAKRAKGQRALAHLICRSAFGLPSTPPLVITLTRCALRKMDSDGLANAFKPVRDGIADWLGVDDGDERLWWIYAQEHRTRGYEVIVDIKQVA